MSDLTLKTALLSAYDKSQLEPLARKLHELEVTLYASGGTASFIRELNLPVQEVADLTSFPAILGGRVKTLHPKIFGGILARREVAQDKQELQQHEIPTLTWWL
jgi:AICAR transformylase/IMP cyclohydrolase PurH (only IMP cyclohydrolase domain in Aful)